MKRIRIDTMMTNTRAQQLFRKSGIQKSNSGEKSMNMMYFSILWI